MKLKGIDSCRRRLFTATRSPTDMVPLATLLRASSNELVRPAQKRAAYINCGRDIILRHGVYYAMLCYDIMYLSEVQDGNGISGLN